ncbi:MAG TPA: ribosome biogenesis GTP-binding protein YihA/YsxC [Firmicutes bacterium]|nr:ribosome biogenesis GTP-binding protein YihA/YsxC [Bacillota bacterium]
MNFHNVKFEASYGLFSQIPPSTIPEIAIAGRSNVGKSSLINKLLSRKSLARVSAVPGKTATINFYDIDNTVKLVDLPGYGFAKVSKDEKKRWAGLIEEYLTDERRDLALVVCLIDIRHDPTKNDLFMLDFLIEGGYPFIVVLTKRDKLSKREYEERMKAFSQTIPYAEQITMIPFSSETGEGVEELRTVLEECVEEAPEISCENLE